MISVFESMPGNCTVSRVARRKFLRQGSIQEQRDLSSNRSVCFFFLLRNPFESIVNPLTNQIRKRGDLEYIGRC